MSAFISFLRRYRAVLAVLAAGVGASLILYGVARHWEEDRIRQALSNDALLHQAEIAGRLDAASAVLQPQ